jgi:FkbM family methyltransferase
MLINNYRNKKLVVYGAGGCFHWFYELFYIKHDIKPIAVIDKRFSKDDSYEGFFATNDIKNLSIDLLKDIAVIVAVGSKDTYDSIRAILQKKGVRDICCLHDFYEIHNPFEDSSSNFLETYKKNRNKISNLRELLSDHLSKKIFDSILQTHLAKLPIEIEKSLADEQYFPIDLSRPLNYRASIFCGADNHDFVKLRHKFTQGIKSLIVCEPDPHVFQDLEECAKNSRDLAKSFQLLQMAVGNMNGVLPFHSANSKLDVRKHVTGYGSMLSPSGESMALSMRLDTLYMNESPTYIAMDIEGGELNALEGAVYILKRSAPDLAISLYHAPEHIWEIIEFISESNSKYDRFYIRNYTGYIAETVLYAFCH